MSGRATGWNRLSLITTGVGLCTLVGAAVLLVLSVAGTAGDEPSAAPDEAPPIIATPRQLVRKYLPTPTASPPPPSAAPIELLAIPKFGVEGPIVVRGVDSNGVMETPDGPTKIAWYDFSARPGFPVEVDGGNAVFSAHVDYYNYGPAVFWNLKDLKRDDVIEVRLTDGTVYKYGVISREQVNAATADLKEIVGKTPEQSITLITCGGTFDPSVGEYDQRVIVRAARIYEKPRDAVAQRAP
ncbi:MAG: class F sortase [Chloroflexi bacterium]|nr:class F sortase [Chloroflexota bacterium]